jgi:CHAT domain-containing protein
LGQAYLHLGHYQEAIISCEQALVIAREIKYRSGEAYALNRLGQAYRRLGQMERARTILQEALAVALALNLHETWTIHHELALIAQQQHQPERAEAEFATSRARLEKLRHEMKVETLKTPFMATADEFYRDYIAFLVGRGQVQQAVELAEAGRARSLLDLLAERHIDVAQGIAPELKQQEKAAYRRISSIQNQLIQLHSQTLPDQSKIAKLEEELKKVDSERKQIEIEIRQKHPQYAELQYPTPLGLTEIQALLDDQTALLEYSLGKDASFLFIVTKDQFQAARLPPESSVQERVRKLRDAMERPQWSAFSTYRLHARALYQELIEPAQTLLAGKQSLIIVPDGILYYLPFEVLLQPPASLSPQTAVRHLPYLVRNFAISYVPSASVLASLRQPRQQPTSPQKTFLAYADPAYGANELNQATPVRSAVRSAFGDDKPWKLRRLTQSRTEVQQIARLYPREQVNLFLGGQASEANVKAEGRLNQYRFLHFAAHGLLNENKPQFSGLILSLPQQEDSRPKTQDPRPTNPQSAIRNPQSEDGLLQVYEIFNLKLNAELVVLSACETGLGKEVKGEGLIGLTRAFLYAGTPSVAVSLWKVEDRSTAELMTRFYRHLKDGRTKAEALRQAQLELIDDGRYAHPYYWAPFVLVGEGQ